MSLIKHYTALFAANGYEIVGSGITLNKRALKLSGLPVKLPTMEALLEDSDSNIIFHPIGESLIHTDSPTLNMMNRILNATLNKAFAMLLTDVSVLASDKDARITKHQRPYLEGLSEYGKAGNKLKKLIEHYDGKVLAKRLISITVDADSMIEAGRFKRTARVTSPLLSYLSNWSKGEKIWGVTINSKKEADLLAKLITNLLPGIDDINTYSTGSNNRVSPNYMAQLAAFKGLYEAMKHTSKRVVATHAEDLLLADLTFVDALEENIAVYESEAPRDLRGNYGEVTIPIAARSKTSLSTAETSAPASKLAIDAREKAVAADAGMSVTENPAVDYTTAAKENAVKEEASLFTETASDMPSWIYGIDNSAAEEAAKKASAIDSRFMPAEEDLDKKYAGVPEMFRPSASKPSYQTDTPAVSKSVPSWAV